MNRIPYTVVGSYTHASGRLIMSIKHFVARDAEQAKAIAKATAESSNSLGIVTLRHNLPIDSKYTATTCEQFVEHAKELLGFLRAQSGLYENRHAKDSYEKTITILEDYLDWLEPLA